MRLVLVAVRWARAPLVYPLDSRWPRGASAVFIVLSCRLASLGVRT
jgi:hypothetical protein